MARARCGVPSRFPRGNAAPAGVAAEAEEVVGVVEESAAPGAAATPVSSPSAAAHRSARPSTVPEPVRRRGIAPAPRLRDVSCSSFAFGYLVTYLDPTIRFRQTGQSRCHVPTRRKPAYSTHFPAIHHSPPAPDRLRKRTVPRPSTDTCGADLNLGSPVWCRTVWGAGSAPARQPPAIGVSAGRGRTSTADRPMCFK
jgi:hypothetical protein